ncbi:unnamed protein product [Candidula unifasciata]|uniref:XK-related protein n=1 Tax=Candidula unifasciata TaxID=100452 RepID=A0A8S3YQ16_9EUPU|nr:unnamed protein product [Candidula unifasciata]
MVKMDSFPKSKKYLATSTHSDTSLEMTPVSNGELLSSQAETDESVIITVIENEYVDVGMSRRSLTIINVHSPGTSNQYEQFFTFGWFDIIVCICSIILFFVDVGTDVNLAVTYFKNNKWLWGAETTVIVVVPSIIVSFLGLHWYIIDYRKEKQKKRQTSNQCVWFLRIVFTLLQCGPVLRTAEYLYTGCRTRCEDLSADDGDLYYASMLRQNVDICLLHLFESFFEAAPQLAIQIYIMIELKPDNGFLHSSLIVLSLLTSWSSLAISLTSYNKSLRINNLQKAKMSLTSIPFYFIWRASEVGGRILCIAMFASVFKQWVFLVLGLHWMIMFIWLIGQKTTFYGTRCLEVAFNLLCGYVMIFCFLNLREGHTRFRFAIFYCIMYTENLIMLAFWFRFTRDLGAWFHMWVFAAVFVLFAIHMTFQLLYYMVFHPTKNIQLCLPCDRFLIYSSMCTDVSPQLGRSGKILYNYRTDVEETASQPAVGTTV